MPEETKPEVNPILNPESIILKKPELLQSKGFIIAMIFVGIAVVVALYALFNMNSASDYQGLIKKVETQTQQLQNKGVK